MSHSPPLSTTTSLENGVLQIDFSIEVAGETVPCVIWKPSAPLEARTLVALGHGGSQHKQAPNIRDRAIHYAITFGWVSLAIDAPAHGERITRDEAEAERLKTERRLQGDVRAPSLPFAEKIAFLDTLAAQAVPEWQAALDTALAFFAPAVDSIGYWGVSQGTWIGVPLLAKEKRFMCAVLGLAHLHPDHVTLQRAAQAITIPLRFAFQWDDPIRSRDYGIALFTAFGSSEKSMHINPGGHTAIPAAEVESWDAFFQRYLR
ncbi:alpha/beta hydrolase [Kouleothrix sp.]|uniref:alpha/beta hydrolase n=1 Tax=Kouleothrix sp. TaxID=2779161 RepID=UPI00391C8052